MTFERLAVVHLAATGFMAGLIWTVHVVHYPLFSLVNEPYRPFQEAHMTRITGLLVVPWAAEALTALGLVFAAGTTMQRTLAITGLALLAVVVLVTAFGAAPIHGQLVDTFDADLHRRLLRVDLVRTVVWTGRLLLAGWMVLLVRST